MVSSRTYRILTTTLFIIGFILWLFYGYLYIADGELATGSLIITVSLAILSIAITIISGRITRTIGEADIQDSIIKMLEVRRRYFEDSRVISERYFHFIDPPKDDRESATEQRIKFRDCTEWTTWMQYSILRRAMKYSLYLSDSNNKGEKNAILNSHKILIQTIMNNTNVENLFIMNRHVSQLLSGCKLLKTELGDLTVDDNNYEEIYEELFSEFLLPRREDEDFLSWVIRNRNAIQDEDVPFHILTE